MAHHDPPAAVHGDGDVAAAPATPNSTTCVPTKAVVMAIR
jgi:hypothetical protein